MAEKSYVGIAPLTMVNIGPGGYAYVFEGAPVPEGASSEEIDRLVDGEFIAEADAKGAVKDSADKPGTVDEILKDVGTDQEKAKAALELEQGRGKDARSTLVAKLEAIANPSS